MQLLRTHMTLQKMLHFTHLLNIHKHMAYVMCCMLCLVYLCSMLYVLCYRFYVICQTMAVYNSMSYSITAARSESNFLGPAARQVVRPVMVRATKSSLP